MQPPQFFMYSSTDLHSNLLCETWKYGYGFLCALIHERWWSGLIIQAVAAYK